MTVFEIKFYFDIICAWSYIGHRTLFQAIDLFQKTYPDASKDDFNIVFLTFYRDRGLPERGVPLAQRVMEFYSDREPNILERVERVGRQHGMQFKFDNLVGHTRNAHRLVCHAGREGGAQLQRALIEQLYFRWHEDSGDITSQDFLLLCAANAGMDEASARSFLEGTECAKEVDEVDATARNAGIKAVPTFDINGKNIEGAADVQTFYEAFVELKESDKGSS